MIELQPGQNIPLQKENPNIKTVTIGVQFKTNDKTLEDNLIFGTLLCNATGKINEKDDLVFFNNLENATQNVEMKDDYQQVDVSLDKVPNNVDRIDFVIWVNNVQRSLSQCTLLKLRIIDSANNNTMSETVNFASNIKTETALCLGQLYRYKGEWKFRAKGDGWANGLNGMLKAYGVIDE